MVQNYPEILKILPLLCVSRMYICVSHQWCDLFYRLLHSPTRHIEEVEGGERDT